MADNYRKLFKYLREQPARVDLADLILLRIRRRERVFIWGRSVAFLGLSLGSLVAGVFSIVSLSTQLVQSGLNDYFSVLISDYDVAVSSASNIVFALVESLPLFGLALFFAAAGLFIWSTAKTIVETQRAFLVIKI